MDVQYINGLQLISFSKKHKLLLFLCLISFVFLLSFDIHGFSISEWRELIDGSKKTEILFGKSREIRRDDWMTCIPLVLSQISHNPSYPIINKNIGFGQNMLAPFSLPVKSSITLFRPSVWGFFLGADKGLSWAWYFTAIGLLYVYFNVFMLVSKNDFYLSLAGSLALLFSPNMQFLSLNAFTAGDGALFIGIMFISIICIFSAEKKTAIIANALLFGWASACFILNIYPPTQVTLGYLFLFMAAAFFIDRRGLFLNRKHSGLRALSFTSSLLIPFCAALLFYNDAHEVISTISHTVYPGTRFSMGGDYALWRLFTNNFFVPLKLDVKDWTHFVDRFIYTFPYILCLLFFYTITSRQLINKFISVMALYLFIILSYMLVGFSETVSTYSFFSKVPSLRCVLGLGIADMLVLISFLSSRDSFSQENNRFVKFLAALLWIALLCRVGYSMQHHIHKLSLFYIVCVAFLTGIFSYYALNSRRSRLFITVFAALVIISCGWFNPVVRGGTSYLYENELSRKILELDKRGGGNTLWIEFGSMAVSNLFRVLGIRSLSGLYPYPQLSLWRYFDADKKYEPEYNRYENILFSIPPPDVTARIMHFEPMAATAVFLYPSDPVLKKLDVDYMLLSKEKFLTFFDQCPDVKKICSIGTYHIYKMLK